MSRLNTIILKEDGIILSFPEWTTNTPNYKGYTIYFNPPGDIPQQKTVNFYKPNGLSRDITFVLRKRWEFVNDYKDSDPAEYKSDIEVFPGYYAYNTDYQTTEVPGNTLSEVHKYIKDEEGLNNPGKIGSSRGAQLTVMFELPGDIPRSLFPLEFKIGFDRQNIENAYVGNAVVVYGESMFEDASRTVTINNNTYFFDARNQMPEVRTGTFTVNAGETIDKVTI